MTFKLMRYAVLANLMMIESLDIMRHLDVK